MYDVTVRSIGTYDKLTFTVDSISNSAGFIESIIRKCKDDVEVMIKKSEPEKEEQ